MQCWTYWALLTFIRLSGQSINTQYPNGSPVKAGFIVSFIFLLLGCATPPQTKSILTFPPHIPTHYEITQVPFYPQKDFFCGPATLSEVLNYYGLTQTQESLAPNLFIPELEGSLQIEMVAAARQHGFLAYAQAGNLKQLLSLISQNIPVIILQNVSIPWYPMWHYSVVVGYDLDEQEVILRSGDIERRVAEFNVFERTWQRGKYWLLAAVPPSKTSQYFDPFIYTRSAQDLLSVGQISQGVTALTSASQQWPDYWLPYFLLGNHFLNIDLSLANYWYQQGYPFAEKQASYLNNYAYALHASGCQTQAINMVEQALLLAPSDSNIIDTQKIIMAKISTNKCRDLSPSL